MALYTIPFICLRQTSPLWGDIKPVGTAHIGVVDVNNGKRFPIRLPVVGNVVIPPRRNWW